MKRRNFIRSAGIASAASIAAPFILPSGRLFAATGMQKAGHVVFCIFGGGVRNLETVYKAEGNLMPHLLHGNEFFSSDLKHSLAKTKSEFTADIFSNPIQQQGTLFKNFRYKTGPTGHHTAISAALTGLYSDANQWIHKKSENPTLFEYFRKYSPSSLPTDAWYISSDTDAHAPLAWSIHPKYGSAYGANYVSKKKGDTNESTGDVGVYSPDNQKSSFFSNFLFPGFDKNETNEETVTKIATFEKSFNQTTKAIQNSLHAGFDFSHEDTKTTFLAEEVIKHFSPKLMVVNLKDHDICHSDFTSYCRNIQKTDYAIAKLWNTIQQTPGMKDNTILIVAPEHGRNEKGNSMCDANGRYGIDHVTLLQNESGDQMAREIFCLVAGPSSVVCQNKTITEEIGESIEILPAIASILGFEEELKDKRIRAFNDSGIREAFV